MRLLAGNARPKPFFEDGLIEADEALGTVSRDTGNRLLDQVAGSQVRRGGHPRTRCEALDVVSACSDCDFQVEREK